MLKKIHIVHEILFPCSKRLFNCLLLFLIGCSGCQNNDKQSLRSWMGDSGKIKVLSSIAQIGDLAAEIGGERVDSWTLIQGTLDPHSYELVKGDGEKLERADIVFFNGLGLEHGANLSQWLKTSEKSSALGDYILEHYPEKILYKGKALDPHIWMDISLWQLIIDPIVDRLSKADPQNALYFQKRAAALQERMDKTHLEVLGMLHQIPASKRYLVTSHDAFHYFTKSYLSEENESDWASRFTAPEGLAPDGQLSPVDIQRIIDYLHQHRVEVIFPESNVSRDSIRKIATAGMELGLKVRICQETLYGDAMDGDNLHYLDMMRHNAEIITKYLKGSP
jgi:manganese/zinc/iron transport system substrate-binding protein